jgi:chromosome partitioning protein
MAKLQAINLMNQLGLKMTKIVSFINLKGGVGKTTTAVNVAATLSHVYKQRVLLIDLDPQTNATVSVISQETWGLQQQAKQTIFHLFNDKLNGTSDFDINKAVLHGVGGIANLDLLPSSLFLIEIQDYIPDISNKAYINSVDVIGNEIEPIKHNYDYIIIDCPPNLGAITLNGINISQHYVVPTVPDILSKIGIDLILNRINAFKQKKHTCSIELAGIIFTKIDYRTSLHTSTMGQLRQGPLKNFIFNAEFPQRISVAEAPIDSMPFLTSRKAQRKQDWHQTQGLIQTITQEFIQRTP